MEKFLPLVFIGLLVSTASMAMSKPSASTAMVSVALQPLFTFSVITWGALRM